MPAISRCEPRTRRRTGAAAMVGSSGTAVERSGAETFTHRARLRVTPNGLLEDIVLLQSHCRGSGVPVGGWMHGGLGTTNVAERRPGPQPWPGDSSMGSGCSAVDRPQNQRSAGASSRSTARRHWSCCLHVDESYRQRAISSCSSRMLGLEFGGGGDFHSRGGLLSERGGGVGR